MENKGSLPRLQQLATCPYREPDQSSPYPHTTLREELSNIILPSTPGTSERSFSLRCPHQNPVSTSPLSIRATCPAHLIILDLITPIIFGEEYRSYSYLLCTSFLHSTVTSSLLGPNILLSTLFSNTLILPSSPSVSDQVSHPYKITGKSIISVYFNLYRSIIHLKAVNKLCKLCNYVKPPYKRLFNFMYSFQSYDG